MFKRNPRTYLQLFVEFFYPRGGWYRAARYVLHRLRRLPDPAHRISRGIAAGVFACFTPFFGMHFVTAALIAFAMRGNILAALLATFFGNPLTFPVIAEISISLGSHMLHTPHDMHLPQVVQAFGHAMGDLWHNMRALFTPQRAHWGDLQLFYRDVFLPYLVGGIVPGVVTALVAYAISNPIIRAYQKRRIRKLKQRYERRLARQGLPVKKSEPSGKI